MIYKLITHGDGDGVGCVVLFKLAFKEDSAYVLANVNNMDELVKKEISYALSAEDESRIFIADLSLQKETLTYIDDIMKSNKNIYITFYDHHDNSIKLKNELRYRWMYVNENECGASLLAYVGLSNHLKMTDAVINFIEDIRARDLYIFDTRETASVLQCCLMMYHTIPFINIMTKRLQNTTESYGYLTDADYKSYEYSKKFKDKYITNCEYVSDIIGGYKVAIVVSSRFISEVCSCIFEKDPDIDYAMVVNTDKEIIQVRAPRDGVDLFEIFKDITGGHKQALSIPYKRVEIANVFMKYVKDQYAIMNGGESSNEDCNGSGCTEDIEDARPERIKTSKRYNKRRHAKR